MPSAALCMQVDTALTDYGREEHGREGKMKGGKEKGREGEKTDAYPGVRVYTHTCLCAHMYIHL